jgi:hypothetical protein
MLVATVALGTHAHGSGQRVCLPQGPGHMLLFPPLSEHLNIWPHDHVTLAANISNPVVALVFNWLLY